MSTTGRLLAGACIVTASWAGAVAMFRNPPLASIAGLLDLVRSVTWSVFILHLFRRTVRGERQRGQAFIMLGLVAALILVVMMVQWRSTEGGGTTFWSLGIAARLGLGVCNILLIENLYMNTPPDARWHISLPCVALGALSIYDIGLSADTLLFQRVSLVLYDGRAIAIAIVAPLLAIGAARNRRDWDVDIHVSRTAVFHSATLMAAGIFLLGLVLAGQAFRYIGPDWGGVAEISLVFAGLVTIGVLLTSGTARSRLRGILVDHFFTHRYDYRREWMRCIATLSTPDAYIALHTRVIRAVAEVLDSPGGMLFLREPGPSAVHQAAFRWAGSRNMPAAAAPIPPDHPLVAAFRDGTWIVEIAELSAEARQEAEMLAGAWVAVPLNHAGRLIGFILAAPPRVMFKLDREVYDLLRIVGLQVATYVAEQRATEVMMQTRELHEYGKRFAFVAHDIKNVSSQLSLLLSNAEHHLANPEFQRDMLATIRASVQKIGALIKRLQAPAGELAETVIIPSERLEAVAANTSRVRGAEIAIDEDGRSTGVAIGPSAFDAVITHLLNNAVEASREAADAAEQDKPPPIRVTIRHEARRALIDIIDQGPGMTAQFIRDELFRPFRSSKPDGSGIGAWQARELIREAGGDLLVISAPGAGTTMRLMLPLVEVAAAS
jgi:putative PEP-CTERM system histidine kinase